MTVGGAGGACRNAHGAAAQTLTNKTCGPTPSGPVSFTKLPAHPLNPATQPLPTFHAASPLSLSPLRKRLRASWLIMVGSALTAALALPGGAGHGGAGWRKQVIQPAQGKTPHGGRTELHSSVAQHTAAMHAFPQAQPPCPLAWSSGLRLTIFSLLLLLFALPLHRRQQLQLVALSLQRQLGHVQLRVGAEEAWWR